LVESVLRPKELYSVRLLGRFRTFFGTRGKNEDSCRKRIARHARQRRVDVARRRRGWRSIAHTVSTCGFANRCCVWSTDAAHLASIVCRQPPKTSSQDRSKPLWTRRGYFGGNLHCITMKLTSVHSDTEEKNLHTDLFMNACREEYRTRPVQAFIVGRAPNCTCGVKLVVG